MSTRDPAFASQIERLSALLPSLWRPQPDDRTLLAEWLAAVGAAQGEAAVELQHVLRAHWADTADAALWATHHQAHRRERGLGPANVRAPQDRAELQRYPWIRDLARLGALLDLPPWREPASLRENVEEYRQRLADIVDAWRLGLCTPDALRRLVDAALPEDMTVALTRQRGRFSIEEPAALRSAAQALTAPPGVQQGEHVAPLARWKIDIADSAGFVIVGATPDAVCAATEMPMIERYTPGATPVGIGVAWTGTLAPDQALRLSPSRRTWLVRDGKLLTSPLETAANAARDPSANGPWTEAASLPAGRIVALARALDGSLWAIQRTLQTWRVQRFNGSVFTAVETDAPAGPFHALCCSADAAWLGTDAGLFRCALWPESGAMSGTLRWEAVSGFTGAVRVLAAHGAQVVAGGADGLSVIAADGSLIERRHAALDLHAVLVEHDPDTGASRRDLIATANALFEWRQGRYWRYQGAAVSEHLPDWQPEATPDASMTSPLPPLSALATTADGSLWLGGPAGLARWHVADGEGTRLEAFAELIGAVHALTLDERGLLWIGADNGLFRFDGRDLARHDFDAGAWIAEGRADTAYPSEISSEPRGHWQYDRAQSRWLRWRSRERRFGDAGLAERLGSDLAIAAALFAPTVRAELGTWDAAGTQFTAAADLAPDSLRLRIKPDELRIVDGVAPWLPPPGGRSDERWRYLQMIGPAPTPPAAGGDWWSKEGQLFPAPARRAAVPGHFRTDPAFLADPDGEGQFGNAAFSYPPSAKLWALRLLPPAAGIRIRLCLADPGAAADPALAERVWNLIERARPAGVPLQLMVEGRIVKESTS